VTKVDRAAAVRAALRALVAERGFHGASMSAVAQAAGVATGTAYTHYESKDALVLAAYLETKRAVGEAVAAADLDGDSASRFRAIWLAYHRYFAAHPDHARFILQVDDSPYRVVAHDALPEDDPVIAAAAAAAAEILPLPLEVLYELGLAPALRLAAMEVELTDAELQTVAGACWRAISR
jgi:AcrR family transcriptional regulator